MNIVFRQCRSLVARPELHEILVKLVPEKEEAGVTKVISKALKKGVKTQATRGWGGGRAHPSPYSTRGRPRYVFWGNCFTCGRSSHMARDCPNRKV